MTSSDGFMPRSQSTRNTLIKPKSNMVLPNKQTIAEIEKNKINDASNHVTQILSSYLEQLDSEQQTKEVHQTILHLNNNNTNNIHKQLLSSSASSKKEKKFFSQKKIPSILINNNNNSDSTKQHSSHKNKSTSTSHLPSMFLSNKNMSTIHKGSVIKEDNNVQRPIEGSENDVKNFILSRHFSSKAGDKKRKATAFGTCFGTGLGSIIGNNNNVNYENSSDALLAGLTEGNNNNNGFNPGEFLLSKQMSSKKKGSYVCSNGNKIRGKGNGTGGFILRNESYNNNNNDNYTPSTFILKHKVLHNNNNNKSILNSNSNESCFVLNHRHINNKNGTTSLFHSNNNNNNSNDNNNNNSNSGFILSHKASKHTTSILNNNSNINSNIGKKPSFKHKASIRTIKSNKNNSSKHVSIKTKDIDSYIIANSLKSQEQHHIKDDDGVLTHDHILSKFFSKHPSHHQPSSTNQTSPRHNNNMNIIKTIKSLKSKSKGQSALLKQLFTKLDSESNCEEDDSSFEERKHNHNNHNAILNLFPRRRSINTSNNAYPLNIQYHKVSKSAHNCKSNLKANTYYINDLWNKYKSSNNANNYFNNTESKNALHKRIRTLKMERYHYHHDIMKHDDNDIRNIIPLDDKEYQTFNKICTQLHNNIALIPQDAAKSEFDKQILNKLNTIKNDDKDNNNINNNTLTKTLTHDITASSHLLPKVKTILNKNNTTTETTFNEQEQEQEQDNNNEKQLLNEIKNRYLPAHLTKVYDSYSDEENIDQINESTYLEPYAKPRLIYDMIIFILEFYSLVFIPYDLAFTLHTTYIIGWKFIMNILIDCMFIIDIILGFFTAYYNNDDSLVKDIFSISNHYINTWFTIDIISGLPLNTILDAFRYVYPNTSFSTASSTSFHSNNIILLNILKCLRLIKLIKVFFHNSFYSQVSIYVLDRFPSGKGFRLIMTLLIFTICIHTFASFLVFIGNAFYPNWIVVYGIEPTQHTEIYVAGIYFVCVSIIGVGYGDILCCNLAEKTLALILLTFGLGIYSWAISALNAFFTVDDLKTYEYKERMELLVDIHACYRNVTMELFTKIEKHLLYRLNSDKIDCNTIVQDLPYSLRNELLFQMYKPIINNFVFFKNFDSLDFIFKVILCLKPVYAVRNEKLISDGELVEETVFVKNGKLSLEYPLPLVFSPETVDGLSRKMTISLVSGVVTYQQTNFIENLLRSGFAERYGSINNMNTRLTNLPMSATILKEKLTSIGTKIGNATNVNVNSSSNNNKHQMDFDIKEFTHNQQYVKLIEIRRNEHFGDVLMFLDIKSPLLAKVKSKKADLFLLKKTDAVDIAGQFPEIWKSIVRKSLFNMKQINRLINRSLKFFFMHYEGQNNNNTGYNGYQGRRRRNNNNKHTMMFHTLINNEMGLLGDDEGNDELESVPDSSDVREEVEMEMLMEKENKKGEGELLGSENETTKWASEKKEVSSGGNLISVSRGNVSGNDDDDNDDDKSSEFEERHNENSKDDDICNNDVITVNKVNTNKEQCSNDDLSSNKSDNSECKFNDNKSQRSTDTIKKGNDNTNTNCDMNNNSKQHLIEESNAVPIIKTVLSTQQTTKENKTNIDNDNTNNNKDDIDDNNIISSQRDKDINSTFRFHTSEYQNTSHILNDSINSEYYSDESDLKNNILFSRSKRSNQPLLNLKPKDNTHLKFPQQLPYNDTNSNTSNNNSSNNSNGCTSIFKKHSDSFFKQINQKLTNKSIKSVTSMSPLNTSINFQSVHNSFGIIKLTNTPNQASNNISILDANIKPQHHQHKPNSKPLTPHSINFRQKRHSVCPSGNSLFGDIIVGSSFKEADVISGNSLIFNRNKKNEDNDNIDINNNNNNVLLSPIKKIKKRCERLSFNQLPFEKFKISPIKKRKDKEEGIMFCSPKKKRLCDNSLLDFESLDAQSQIKNKTRRKSMVLPQQNFELNGGSLEEKKVMLVRRKSRLDVISDNIANNSLNLNNPGAFYSSMFAKVIGEEKKDKEGKGNQNSFGGVIKIFDDSSSNSNNKE